MTQPKLTFFCELAAPALATLFAETTLMRQLTTLGADVSLGILDLSPQRASVVQRLNESGVPTIAWLLLPQEQGYWFGAGNAAQAVSRYANFRRWSQEHHLRWSGIGLDIEPDIREMQNLKTNPWALLPRLAGRALDMERLHRAQLSYTGLVAHIHADGYRVDSYHIPWILDERKAGSTLLQRLAGLVDVPTDREVLMLYTSLGRPWGPAMLWTYGREAQSIGVGVTGGGVELTEAIPPLEWEEFSRDLLLAAQQTKDIHIFSLEGCVRQGFMARLVAFDWGQHASIPSRAAQMALARQCLRTGLWVSNHPGLILAGIAASLVLRGRCRKGGCSRT